MRFLIIIVFIAGYTFKGNEALMISKFKESMESIFEATTTSEEQVHNHSKTEETEDTKEQAILEEGAELNPVTQKKNKVQGVIKSAESN